jgi:hypothetical protein
MSRIAPSILASIALFAMTGAPGLALAAELPLSGPEVTLAPAVSADTPEVLNQDALANESGGTDVHVNETNALSQQDLTATSTGNSVVGNIATGQVTFAPGALASFNGIGNFVVNTGANNIVQGSINVTIATGVPGQ